MASTYYAVAARIYLPLPYSPVRSGHVPARPRRRYAWPMQPPRPRVGRSSWRLVLLGTVVALLVAGGLIAAGDRRSPARGSSAWRAALAPEQGTLLGAWVAPDWSKPGAAQKAVVGFERRIGRKLAIDQHFYPWSKPYPTWRERADLDAGRIPLISWNGTDTTRIAAGAEDDLIRARAAAVHDLGRPILLRWFWEMDGHDAAVWVPSPASFVAAWRHIHELFAAAGATNVIWAWCPNAAAFTSGKAPPYYPGDAYVDWICADGYNWAPGRPGDSWQSFADIFADFYAWAAPRGKPLMVAEFGAQERAPGEKARWIADAQRAVKERFPRIAALVYFNEDRDGYDWRVETSPSAEAAFRDLARDPYFSPDWPDG